MERVPIEKRKTPTNDLSPQWVEYWLGLPDTSISINTTSSQQHFWLMPGGGIFSILQDIDGNYLKCTDRFYNASEVFAIHHIKDFTGEK